MPKNLDVKRANIALHEKTARYFEEKNIQLFNPFAQKNLHKRLNEADQTCKKNKICCDLACGAGNLIEKQMLNFEQVIGLDISKEMIKVCKAKGLANGAYLVVGDAENLPFRDNAFDIVTMHAALHHLPSPSNCFKEIYRTLVKDGIMYIDHEPNSRRLRKASEKVKEVMGLVGGMRARKHMIKQLSNNPLFPFEYWLADLHVSEGFSPREIQRKLEAIGFCEARIKYHDTFSSYFFKLPTPLNALSFLDNIIDRLPLVRKLAAQISIWAQK
jgi:ubiquinone/menaquinone biosynthesis C-methylase UbiE